MDLRSTVSALNALRFAKAKVFRPYPKQKLLFDLGATKRERGFLAANRVGKTHAVAHEVSFHLTGDYPDWWEGKRFNHPVTAWAGCTSAEQVRDGAQSELLGDNQLWGTGTIPRANLLDVRLARGVTGAVDYALVKHRLGGTSRIQFKSYDQRRSKWQVEAVHVVWMDEEPTLEIYTEALTRTNDTGGIVILSATPLLGMSDVMSQFYPNPTTPARALVQMQLHEADHFTPKQIAEIEAQYPDYEVEARTKGIPMLGSGRVYPLSEAAIVIEPFQVPSHWGRLGALDFGWDHPTAAVLLAYDPDADQVIVTRDYSESHGSPAQHAMTLRHWGEHLAWAWPHDGTHRGKDGAAALADQYRAQGLKMLPDFAHYLTARGEKNWGVEAGVMDILDRMKTYRFKVFRTCSAWLDEFRLYHRKDGKIVEKRDDAMDATRTGVMMVRYARPERAFGPGHFPKQVGMEYDPFARPPPTSPTYDPFRVG